MSVLLYCVRFGRRPPKVISGVLVSLAGEGGRRYTSDAAVSEPGDWRGGRQAMWQQPDIVLMV